MTVRHWDLDQSDCSTLAVCRYCSWRTVRAEADLAAREAATHVLAHLDPQQRRLWGDALRHRRKRASQ